MARHITAKKVDGGIAHKHIFIHHIQWKNGSYGRCPNRGVHVHDLLDKIIVQCQICGVPYTEDKKAQALNRFVDANTSLLKRPERLDNLCGV